MMIKTVLIFASVIILSYSAIAQNASAQENQAEKAARERAEQLLETVRSERWLDVYDFVVIKTGKNDKETRERMGITGSDSLETVKQKVGQFFKNLYGQLKPGKIKAAKLNDNDKTRVLISYRHEDLDGFYLKLVDGEWYYTLEF